MGNEKSKHAKPHQCCSSGSGTDVHEPERQDGRLEMAYKNLCAGTDGAPTFSTFHDAFGEDLAESLWFFLTDTKSKKGTLSEKDFCQRASKLFGNSTDIYITICQPVYHLIKVCSEAAGANAVDGDQKFIATLAKEMMSTGEKVRDMIAWSHQNMPKLCHSVQSLVLHKFLQYEMHAVDYSSDILSPIQMWYLQCCLPSVYFTNKEKSIAFEQWTPLYTSASQGISVNRFETNVFDYKGPTLSIFQLTDSRLVALAVDQEWRHSGTLFGGPSTVLLELSPSLLKIESSSSIYCNFKIRSLAFGLSFKNALDIDKDFGNVTAIEVWGCAPANTHLEQQKLKQWQHKQAERHKKVPLPGNWDDNPDKTLLEMAGFQFSNERKLMEMEGRK